MRSVMQMLGLDNLSKEYAYAPQRRDPAIQPRRRSPTNMGRHHLRLLFRRLAALKSASKKARPSPRGRLASLPRETAASSAPRVSLSITSSTLRTALSTRCCAKNGKLVQVSWDEALTVMVEKFRATQGAPRRQFARRSVDGPVGHRRVSTPSASWFNLASVRITTTATPRSAWRAPSPATSCLLVAYGPPGAYERIWKRPT